MASASREKEACFKASVTLLEHYRVGGRSRVCDMLSFSDVLTGARFSLGVVLLSAGLIGLVLVAG